MNSNETSNAQHVASAGSSAAWHAQDSITVLYVDDDPNDTELLRAALRKAGLRFSLDNVEDGEHAIAYLDSACALCNRAGHKLPSLILLDIKMPRTTGFDVLRWIRSHPPLRHVPVVVLSGSELQDDIKEAFATGASSYLIKPLGFHALVELIQRVSAAWLAVPPTINPLSSGAASRL